MARYPVRLALGAALMLAGCDQCIVEPFKSSTSPKADTTFRLERTNCGATTGYLYAVMAYKTGASKGIRFFQFDGDHGRFDWPSPWEDDKLLDMKWVGPSQVNVILNYPVRIYEERKSVDGVAIRYSFRPGTARDD